MVLPPGRSGVSDLGVVERVRLGLRVRRERRT